MRVWRSAGPGRHHPAARRCGRQRRQPTRCAAVAASTARSTEPGARDPADCIERFPDGLATGEAGWTTAGELPARWVIHVVGPNYRAGQTDRGLLTSCYSRALDVADELGVETMAFPLVSAGIYGWPLDDAAAAAVETLRSIADQVREARLVAFGHAAYDALMSAAARRPDARHSAKVDHRWPRRSACANRARHGYQATRPECEGSAAAGVSGGAGATCASGRGRPCGAGPRRASPRRTRPRGRTPATARATAAAAAPAARARRPSTSGRW